MSTSNDRSEPERLDAYRANRRGTTAESVSPDDADAHDDDAQHGDTQTPAQFEEASAVKRARQIERLREAVEAEEYRPNPGQIAESMMENERT